VLYKEAATGFPPTVLAVSLQIRLSIAPSIRTLRDAFSKIMRRFLLFVTQILTRRKYKWWTYTNNKFIL